LQCQFQEVDHPNKIVANHFVLHLSQGVAIGPEYAAIAWEVFCRDYDIAPF